MGNDGGSIPKRRELVKEAARNPTTTELKESQNEQQEYYWSTDPISRKPLSRPVVADSNGRLYNKDTILEFLLPSDDAASKVDAEKVLLGAVKSLRDVVEIQFEVDTDPNVPKNGSSRSERWVCPMTNKPLGPGAKAVYLVPCGHAFAGVAIKEVSDGKCLQCNESYAPNDVIPILPTDPTEIARLSLRVKTLKEKGLTHSLKKAPGSKKRKKNAETEAEAQNGEAANGTTDQKSTKPLGKPASAKSSARTNINNAATASLTARVLEEQDALNKRRKMETNENLKTLFSSRDQSKPTGKSSDFMTRGFSIPANAKR